MVKTRAFWAKLFCVPSLLLLAVVAFWPLFRTIYFSLTNANLASLETIEWVGLTNYANLLEDPDWWLAVQNTTLFAVVSVTLETILGLFIALVLNSTLRGRGFLRAAVLVPWAIPTIVSAKMWAWMLHDLYGVVNHVLVNLGIVDVPIPWLANSNLAFVSIVMVDVWKTTPFMALLLLAGLQGIPKSLFEVSRLDGASFFQTLRNVILPLLKPALIVAVLFRTLDALRVFDLVYVLTSNSKDTASMSVYARQQLVDFQDFGYGSAASTVIFLFIALLTIVLMRLNRSQLEVGGA